MLTRATPASPAAVDSKDDKQPYTDSWSVTLEQTTPWQGTANLERLAVPQVEDIVAAAKEVTYR